MSPTPVIGEETSGKPLIVSIFLEMWYIERLLLSFRDYIEVAHTRTHKEIAPCTLPDMYKQYLYCIDKLTIRNLNSYPNLTQKFKNSCGRTYQVH